MQRQALFRVQHAILKSFPLENDDAFRPPYLTRGTLVASYNRLVLLRHIRGPRPLDAQVTPVTSEKC